MASVTSFINEILPSICEEADEEINRHEGANDGDENHESDWENLSAGGNAISMLDFYLLQQNSVSTYTVNFKVE
jgi:hypothetical protein